MKPFINPSSLHFLQELSVNNNRNWFEAHKQWYLDSRENVLSVVEVMLELLNEHDLIETPSASKSLFRIYRDVRFSKDKTPYSPHWMGGFKRATKLRRGGYYYHFEPGNSWIIGGFWHPSPQDLSLIRQDIAFAPEQWKKLLSSRQIRKTFGSLSGEKLRTAPRGFSKDDPALELLRHKQFLLKCPISDECLTSKDLPKQVNGIFKDLRPFFDHMSDLLSSDGNGEII